MKYALIIILACLQTPALVAQEYNFGVHINPILSSPVLGSASTYDSKIKVSPMRAGMNIGADANIKFGKWRIETGFNVMDKTIVFNQRTLSPGGIAYTKDIIHSTSFEVPLVLGYKILTRNKRTFYHLYGLAGVSYENNHPAGTSGKAGSQGDGSINVVTQNVLSPTTNYQWVNVIAGFHINAIVQHIGLIDYGISYHYPLTTSGAHNVTTTVGAGSGQVVYNGTFYPHMSYINFKLCYYFLNLDNSFRRKRYHQM